ncbi:MAG: IPT/TIG domain-containing protein [Tannerella sp.]|jgi:DNA-binding beta-propeller fold protein YncE|nr:IPT/TIG domain-containing protein [Tannerella sp.]
MNSKIKFSVMRIRKLIFRSVLVCATACLTTAGCNEDKGNADNPYDKPHNPNNAIEVKSISPVSGGIGAKIVVTGSNFGNDKSKVQLFFNEKKSLIMNIQDNAIYALVPIQPGDFSTIKVVVDGKEAVLEGMQFQYFIRTAVTTVSGQVGVSVSLDGPALQATYTRPVMMAASDDGLVFVADDSGHKIRLLSTKDNVVTTVIDEMSSPWQIALTPDQNKLYIVERERSGRPILFYALSRNTNWMQREIYYDQKDAQGNFIAGDMPYAGLTCDENYVYMICQGGARLIRVHQETRKVEVIGQNFSMGDWNYLTWNRKDRKLYCASEEQARLYRFDPYHVPPGRTAPWLTYDDVEHIAGMSPGSVIEGNKLSIRTGLILGLASDNDGNVYLSDDGNSVIWKIDQELNGTVIAGRPGVRGYKDGDPKEAEFNRPYCVSATSDGLLYVADMQNRVIRCIAIQ